MQPLSDGPAGAEVTAGCSVSSTCPGVGRGRAACSPRPAALCWQVAGQPALRVQETLSGDQMSEEEGERTRGLGGGETVLRRGPGTRAARRREAMPAAGRPWRSHRAEERERRRTQQSEATGLQGGI
uniref:Uncharacterized protein n=1 Tax=Myotis myotis TaxID=51298 RepID=A0A7J7RLR3_MYOMY|nr:hypothetical protein mMyoMyo1_010272 [Myotis myotis]